ncbi:MAG: IS200/IS605 family transposase [Bdellovibrionota bacterium]
MENYRKGSHTIFDCKYHLVWVTKYRYQVLMGEVGVRLRELIRQQCMKNRVQILKGHVAPEHVHLHVSVPPNIAISKLLQNLKGYSSHKLLQEFKTLSKRYWGQHLWARDYFVATTGTVTDEVIQQYIAGHESFEKDDGFTIGHERL